MTTDSTTNESDTQRDNVPPTPDTFPIRSPYRPLTREARKELADYTILEDLEASTTGRMDGVRVETRPPEDLLTKHELVIDLPLHLSEAHRIEDMAESIWRSDSDSLIVIYPDRVEVDGEEYGITPDEARERMEQERNMERLWTRSDSA